MKQRPFPVKLPTAVWYGIGFSDCATGEIDSELFDPLPPIGISNWSCLLVASQGRFAIKLSPTKESESNFNLDESTMNDDSTLKCEFPASI
jgi:hypothetical protein